jgi:hypothetical protein
VCVCVCVLVKFEITIWREILIIFIVI